MSMYVRNADEIHRGIWHDYHYFQSIGYPLVINLLRSLPYDHYATLALLQGIASSITLYFIYRATTDSFGSRIGFWALLISTFHAPWILYANFALPEVFFTMLLSICAYATVQLVGGRKIVLSSVVWGLSFMAAFWLKGTHAFFGPAFFLALLLRRKKEAFLPMAIISVIGISSLLGHGFLTKKTIGKFQLSASTGGLNFVEGKCPSKVNRDSAGFGWQSPLYYQLRLNDEKTWPRPFTDSGYFFKEGLKCIETDPLVLVQSFESIPYLFFGNHLWPFTQKQYGNFTRLYDLLFAVFSVIGLTLYFFSMKREQRQFDTHLFWALPVLSLFLCVYVFKAELRYRVPFDVWLIPLAVKGWDFLGQKRRLS